MVVNQISAFVENKSGRLASITKILAENSIDIQALCIADTTDFGILRMIVNSPEKAVKVLKDSDVTVRETEVIAVAIEDKPGGLAKALKVLQDNNIGIEYMYAFTEKKLDHALVILRVENNEASAKILAENGIEVVPAEVVYNL